MECPNKRKANDDDDVSVVSATHASAVSVTSGASTGSQKQHAVRPAPQDVSGLCDDLNTMHSAFQTNFHMNAHLMEHLIQSSSSRSSNQLPHLVTSFNAANAAADNKSTTRATLLERKQDFFMLDELYMYYV